MSLHPDFKMAKWRGTTNTDGKVIGVSFEMEDGSIVRIALELKCARHVSESIAEYLNAYLTLTNTHSESSSGSPSSDVSEQRE